MEYTHYWRQQRDFTDAEWDQIKKAFGAIHEKSGVLLTGPSGEPNDPIICDDGRIEFNGVEDENNDHAHETFIVEKIKTSGFEFCKTACKPYDDVVTGLLLYIDHAAPGAMSISSDGNMSGVDWETGRNLFESVK